MKIDWTLLGVLGLFFAGMLAVGAWASRKQKSAADFYVGGRRFGALTVTATQIASAFGGGMLIAHVGLGYAFGLAEMVYMTAIALGVLALALTAARWLRRQDFYTTTDWMVHQYGDSKTLRATTSVVAMLVTMSWWVSQPIAAGKVMNSLTGLPVEVGIAVSAAVVIVYTMTGGIIAVAYTDLAQLGLMLLGMFVLLPLAMSEAGGLDAVLAAQPEVNLTAWAPGKLVVFGWILAVLPGQMVLQLYHQRIFAARSDRVARSGLVNLAISCVLAGAWATLLGMALYKLNPDLTDRDTAVTWCVIELLPRTVGVIVLGAVVAAIISTADSALHSTSASITRDIYQGILKTDATDEDVLRFSKKCIIAVGVVGVGAGVALPSIIEVLVLGYTLTVSGLFFPLFIGRVWRGATGRGAVAGMIVGVLTTLALTLIPGVKEVMPPIGGGLAMSLIALVLVSLATRASPPE